MSGAKAPTARNLSDGPRTLEIEMKLWMGNIAPDTSYEEIMELVKKYAPELTCTNVQRVEATGSRPGAILKLTGGESGVAEKLSLRSNGMFWKQRALVSQRMRF